MVIDKSVHDYLNNNKILPDDQHYLYVGVKGGGCSGLQYVFEVVHWEPEKYIVLDNMYVCTDKKSLLFLKETTLVYKSSIGASVLVVENPGVASVCGCGSSFSL